MAKVRKPKDVQPSLFEEDTDVPETVGADTSSTFLSNLSLPIHRWFRYSAGFSAQWVREVITREKVLGRSRILDPFAGSGTVVLEAETAELEGVGSEAHPFICRVAQAKLGWRIDPDTLIVKAGEILDRAKQSKTTQREFAPLLTKCYPPETLARLESLRRGWETKADGSPVAELCRLALVGILRECSPVGTAQWQYVLPKKTKAKSLDPYDAFLAKARQFAKDMSVRQRQAYGPPGRIIADDARELASVPDRWADLVITSPPYANNYDYADATRLEMTFFGEIEGWSCLQEKIRRHLVHSCTQHVSPLIKQTEAVVADPKLKNIAAELTVVCAKLAEERKIHGGKKAYHTMIAAYFRDLAAVWIALRRTTIPGCRVCFVIGDSAPYGIYVSVDRWLGELALAAGFKSYRFEKTRDRNLKWKNRKHRVPLQEGRLWVEG